MELIHLKAPPDRVRLIADVLEDYITDRPAYPKTAQLTEVLTWLRYRLARWEASHPRNPAV